MMNKGILVPHSGSMSARCGNSRSPPQWRAPRRPLGAALARRAAVQGRPVDRLHRLHRMRRLELDEEHGDGLPAARARPAARRDFGPA